MLDKYELQEKLRAAIEGLLKQEGVILVDLRLIPQGKKSILRILLDEPGSNIALERCASLNKAISEILDRENLIPESYVLEVSSPGIDRPLLTRDDFSRCLNRKVKILLNDPLDDQAYEIVGTVTSVTDRGLSLNSAKGVKQIEFSRIKKAKQIIEEIRG